MPEASGEDLALAAVLDFEEAVGVAEFELGAGGEGFEGGVGEAGDEFEAFVFEGLEVDFAAHAAVKNEHGVLDLKASAKDLDGAAQRGGVGTVASQRACDSLTERTDFTGAQAWSRGQEINGKAAAFLSKSQPVISLDTTKNKPTAEQMASIKIERSDFYGEWN